MSVYKISRETMKRLGIDDEAIKYRCPSTGKDYCVSHCKCWACISVSCGDCECCPDGLEQRKNGGIQHCDGYSPYVM